MRWFVGWAYRAAISMFGARVEVDEPEAAPARHLWVLPMPVLIGHDRQPALRRNEVELMGNTASLGSVNGGIKRQDRIPGRYTRVAKRLP